MRPPTCEEDRLHSAARDLDSKAGYQLIEVGTGNNTRNNYKPLFSYIGLSSAGIDAADSSGMVRACLDESQWMTVTHWLGLDSLLALIRQDLRSMTNHVAANN